MQKPVHANPVFEALAQNLFTRIPFMSHSHVLDIGCRDGRGSFSLAKYFPHLNILALDKHKDFINAAMNSEKYAEFKNRVKFLHSEYTDLQAQSEFDAVVSVSCLNWLESEERTKTFQSLFKVLKANAKAHFILFGDHGRKRFDDCIYNVASRNEWKGYFQGFEKSMSRTPLSAILSESEKSGMLFESAETRTFSYTFADREGFKNFVKCWSTHPLYLPENLREKFLDEVVDAHGSVTYFDYTTELTLSAYKNTSRS